MSVESAAAPLIRWVDDGIGLFYHGRRRTGQHIYPVLSEL